ncbi:MAG: chemotaxis protein CheW [Methylophilaceae bacterium]
MTIDMSQFFQVFFDESEELLAEAERLLMALDISNPDAEDLNAIFRAAHSIKGGAATFGMNDMTEITHVLESLLDKIRKHEIALTSEHVDAFLAAKDILEMQLDGHRQGSAVNEAAVNEVKFALQGLSEGVNGTPVPVSNAVNAAPASVSVAQPEATSAALPVAGATHCYHIGLPELPERDVAALAAELTLLGEVTKTKQANGCFAFTLTTEGSESDIIAICSFVLDTDSLSISEQSSPARSANDAAPACYRILLPELLEHDVTTLAAELALLGQVAHTKQDNGRYIVKLTTVEKQADVVAICSFVLDPDTLEISEEVPAAPATTAENNAQAHDPGYGFFEPLPAGMLVTPSAPEVPSQPPVQQAQPGAAVSLVVPDHLVAAESPEVGTAAENKPPLRRQADKAPAATQETTSIRVGIEKVDQLINLVGELVITQAMIEQRTSALDPIIHNPLLNSVSQLTRNTRDLQEAVMSIRMMPMDYVFSRFPRMVRDLATKLGKKVEFITNGAATELDKGLIERIVDPLTHLVRNSVDHGIEMPEVRVADGKNEIGRLSLSAGHQGGYIVIEVSDDGAGLKRERILEKAKQQGLPVSDTMSDNEVWQLIFAPGFSTAEVITDVSGRGVGMDVVKRNITAMGGSVDIRSARGFGTTIKISLPLTLAILDGMSVNVGAEIYILPLSFVIESLQPAAEDIKEVAGQGRLVKVREEYLPLIPLYQIFGIESRCTDPTQGILVILQADGKKAALLVDGLVGQQQVVVKNLESNYRKVAGISGATILGDGGVSFILDVTNLMRSSLQPAAETVYF